MSDHIKSTIEVGGTGITIRGWDRVRPEGATRMADLQCKCELIVAHVPTMLSPEQLQLLRDAVDAMLQCSPRKHPGDY